jgi:antitoxin component YwqK of YwqJK toxin-antitoxin module
MKTYISILFIFLSCHSDKNIVREYYDSGNIKSEYALSNGKKNGVQRDFYENGVQRKIAHYLDDILTGEYIQFDSLGRIAAKGIFNMGKAVGPTYYFQFGKKALYNERDYSGNVYYVQKWDSLGIKIKEEGCCLSKDWIEDYTVENSKKYRFAFFYAEPDSCNNNITGYINGKQIQVEKTVYHQAVIQIPNLVSSYQVTVYSKLTSKDGQLLCQDSLVKNE